MNYKEYSKKMVKMQEKFLLFIEKEEDIEENYENLIHLIFDQKFISNNYEKKSFLYLISKIAANHYRGSMFFEKITKILLQLKDLLKSISNFELFQIFKENKTIILFLIQKNIITIDELIYNQMMSEKSLQARYNHFFQPELEQFKNGGKKLNRNFPEDFDEKRRIGENDNYISKLIRKDLIGKFIEYVNRNKYSLNSKIIISIYETNPLLVKEKVVLIEYAAFFGSIQIFKYLYSNGARLNGSIWIYAIHSNKKELINFLIINKILPNDESFEECLKESIKCHHNVIANYIIDNLMEDKNKSKNSVINYDKNIYSYCFHYYNFTYFPDLFNLHSIIMHANMIIHILLNIFMNQ